jgi:hypothetical protein
MFVYTYVAAMAYSIEETAGKLNHGLLSAQRFLIILKYKFYATVEDITHFRNRLFWPLEKSRFCAARDHLESLKWPH